MIENDNYIFPENKWYLKIDDENINEVNNWRINIIKAYNYPCQFVYINSGGGGDWGDFVGGRKEITTSQFRKYVLKQDEKLTSIIKENYNYLIELFEKLGIK